MLKTMNNEMTCHTGIVKTNLVMNQLLTLLGGPLQWLCTYYGKILERPVTLRQTLHLLSAQMAFVATVFVSGPVLFRLLCMAWLVTALLKCREWLTATAPAQ